MMAAGLSVMAVLVVLIALGCAMVAEETKRDSAYALALGLSLVALVLAFAAGALA